MNIWTRLLDQKRKVQIQMAGGCGSETCVLLSIEAPNRNTEGLIESQLKHRISLNSVSLDRDD